jgi:hypothetical protein
MSEIIQLDLSEQDQCEILEIYLKETLSETSFEIWDELTTDIEPDMNTIFLAAGKAVMNEAINKVIESGIEEDRKVTFKILTCDEPSPYNGRIYPREEMEKAVADYQQKIEDDLAMGRLYYGDSQIVNLAEVSHLVTHMIITDDGDVVAKVKILDTTNGQLVSVLLEDLRLAPAMTGQISDNIVSDITIQYTSFLPKDTNNEE